MRIDSHHHLWRYVPADYPWISDRMAVLKHDFLPADLEANLAAAHVDASVAVQASQTVDETRWLLELARAHSAIRGVVGWVPLIDPKVEGTGTFLFNQVPCRQAFDVVLRSLGLAAQTYSDTMVSVGANPH